MDTSTENVRKKELATENQMNKKLSYKIEMKHDTKSIFSSKYWNLRSVLVVTQWLVFISVFVFLQPFTVFFFFSWYIVIHNWGKKGGTKCVLRTIVLATHFAIVAKRNVFSNRKNSICDPFNPIAGWMKYQYEVE